MRRIHLVVFLVGGLAIAAHALVVPEPWQEWSYDGVELYTLAAMVWAIRHHRPRPARPWWLLAAGLGLLVTGDVVFNAITRLSGHEVFPSAADGFYLTSYVVLSWGVLSMLRARRRGRDRTALHDVTLVTVVAAVVTWVYLVDPSLYEAVPLLEAVISAAYPVGDIALLAFLVRLLVSSTRRPPSERVLAAGIGLLLLADIAYARLALTGSYSVGGWLDLVYHLSYLCLAVAAAHPGMGRVAAPEEDFAPSGRSRRGLVMGFSLVLPVLATLEVIEGHRHQAVLLAAASTAVFFLLILRTGALNASLADVLTREQEALDRERVLRAMGLALVGATDRDVIGAAVVHHARLLAGPGAEAVVALGEPGAWRVVTAGHSLRLPAGALLDGVPSEVETALQAGRATVVAPGAALGFGAALSEAIALRPLVLAPLVVGGRLAGAVVVAPRHRAGGAPRLLEACEALGSAASLALESAQLAERLVDERSEQRFGAMIRNSSDILLMLRPDGTVRYLSPSATRILGWRAEDLHGRHVRDLVHAGDAAMVATAFHRALTQAGTHGPIECRVLHRDGSWRFLEAVGTGLHDDPGLSGVVVNVRDVTDRVRLEDELSHQAFHDPLTGLPNRALFMDRVEHALGGARDRPVEILFLDLDEFKTVNDSLGHPVGDGVLVAVAERLRECLRPSDTAARLGGDEFAVLLAGGDGGGRVVAERIVSSLRRPVRVGDQELVTTASVGVARGEAGTPSADLLRRADLAMYVAKAEGKDRWVGFRAEMLEELLDDLELERALRAAVADQALEVHYQPIVDLYTGAVTGAEALVRWSHPERGPVPPLQFIPIAERSDLIEEIGRFVLRRACRTAASWERERGRTLSHVAVNVSARQLKGETLVQDVARALGEAGLAPHKLVLEITESLLLDDLAGTVGRLEALRRLGVRIAVDDFGTGYSSLSYLGRLPVDLLKIDRSFVAGLDSGDERNLVPAILQLAQTLDLATVAEGVETLQQAEHLAELGCELAQGYHFSRPVPEAELGELLERPPAAVTSWAGSGPHGRRRPAPGTAGAPVKARLRR